MQGPWAHTEKAMNLQFDIPRELHVFPDLHVVGGAVRDRFLGREVNDIDLCTSATPEEMGALCEKHDLSYIPTGLKHGTITVLAGIDGQPYEVTTMRMDVSCDGRHADVAWTRSIEADLARRDFTINAMAWNVRTGQLVNPYGGFSDLTDGIIRAVGDPAIRFKEDHLRIIRMVRFHTTLEMEVDPATWEAARMLLKEVDLLELVSHERIIAETDKVLRHSAQPAQFERDLTSLGAWQCCPYPLGYWAALASIPSARSRWIWLMLTDETETIPLWWERGSLLPKYLRQDARRIDSAVECVTDWRLRDFDLEEGRRRFLHRFPLNPQDLDLFRRLTTPEEAAYAEPPEDILHGLPFGGDVLKSHGLTEGIQMGAALRTAQEHYFVTGCTDRDELLAVALSA